MSEDGRDGMFWCNKHKTDDHKEGSEFCIRYAEGERAATERIVAFLERHADMWGECSADCLETLRDYITEIQKEHTDD